MLHNVGERVFEPIHSHFHILNITFPPTTHSIVSNSMFYILGCVSRYLVVLLHAFHTKPQVVLHFSIYGSRLCNVVILFCMFSSFYAMLHSLHDFSIPFFLCFIFLLLHPTLKVISMMSH
jgi:hypothetical protein